MSIDRTPPGTDRDQRPGSAAGAQWAPEDRRTQQSLRRQQVLRRLLASEPTHAPDGARPPGTVVGVELGNGESSIVVHAVGNLGDFTPRLGMSSCGFPAEYLSLVPDLAWTDVHRSLRCEHCCPGDPAAD